VVFFGLAGLSGVVGHASPVGPLGSADDSQRAKSMAHLETIRLSYCSEVSLVSVFCGPKLKSLQISNCPDEECAFDLVACPALAELEFRRWSRLRHSVLSRFAGLPSVTSLTFSDVPVSIRDFVRFPGV